MVYPFPRINCRYSSFITPPPEYKACWIIQPVDVSPLAVAFYPDDCTYGRDVSWARGKVVCAIMSIFACKLSMVCPYGCYFS